MVWPPGERLAIGRQAAGIAVAPIGDELERWQLGYFTFTDAELLRLAESRGLVEVSA